MPANPLPRYRGFNLLEMFIAPEDPAGREVAVGGPHDFRHSDLQWIADWGFDFVRIPMDYRFWGSWNDPLEIRESTMARIDRLLDLAAPLGIHVCLNFHRAPGYSVNSSPPEPRNLWKEADLQAAFCHHWRYFAKRYASIPSSRLSFNLINEPQHIQPAMSKDDHHRVITAGVQAIREVDAQRLLIIDGLDWGNTPMPELAHLKVAQSCRAYWPFSVSHYKAPWVPVPAETLPTWPGGDHFGEKMYRQDLKTHYKRWAALTERGVGVICGEGGAWKMTPHHVLLPWIDDVCDILKQLQIGFILWNFRGTFGVLDSERTDCPYTDYHGHKLDRQLLDILQKY